MTETKADLTPGQVLADFRDQALLIMQGQSDEIERLKAENEALKTFIQNTWMLDDTKQILIALRDKDAEISQERQQRADGEIGSELRTK